MQARLWGAVPVTFVNKCLLVFRFLASEKDDGVCVFAMAAWGMSHLLCVAFTPLSSSSVFRTRKEWKHKSLCVSLQKTWSSHCHRVFPCVCCHISCIINRMQSYSIGILSLMLWTKSRHSLGHWIDFYHIMVRVIIHVLLDCLVKAPNRMGKLAHFNINPTQNVKACAFTGTLMACQHEWPFLCGNSHS